MFTEKKNNSGSKQLFLKDKPVFVYHKERDFDDISILSESYYEIDETDIGYEITIYKKGSYVGLSFPNEGKVIAGNKPYYVSNFDGNPFVYNKKQSENYYQLREDQYCSISLPIFHQQVDENTHISVSPTSSEEALVTPYYHSVDKYVKIETYAHHQNEFVKFFIDISSNYLINLRRVSENVEYKNYVNDDLADDHSKMMSVFHNSSLEYEIDQDWLKKAVKVANYFQSFLDDLSIKNCIVGDLVYYLNGVGVSGKFPIEFVVSVENKKKLYSLKKKISKEVKDVTWYSFPNSDLNSYFLNFWWKGFNVRIKYFQMLDVYGSSLCDDSITASRELKHIKLDLEILNRFVELQRKNLVHGYDSFKENELIEFGRIKNLIGKVGEVETSHFDTIIFKDSKVKANLFGTDQIIDKNKLSFFSRQMDKSNRIYEDVRITDPFFINCYRTGENLYYPFYTIEEGVYDMRVVFGKRLKNFTVFTFENNGAKQIDNDRVKSNTNFDSVEIFVGKVKRGGVIKIER